jgi:hypothetical protein
MYHRNYRFKDLEMLMAAQDIAENLRLNISALSSAYPEFNMQFIKSLSERIDKGFEYFLGLGTSRELQRIKNSLNSVQAQSLRAIAFLKTLIELRTGNDLNRKKQILDLLGSRKYLKAIQNNDTLALLGLLSNIRDNMNDSLKDELIKNKSDEVFLERISEYAQKLNKANRSKESLNATRKAIEEEAQLFFNDIYTSVITVCKKGARFYHDNPEKRSLFTFSKAVARIKTSAIVT